MVWVTAPEPPSCLISSFQIPLYQYGVRLRSGITAYTPVAARCSLVLVTNPGREGRRRGEKEGGGKTEGERWERERERTRQTERRGDRLYEYEPPPGQVPYGVLRT